MWLCALHWVDGLSPGAAAAARRTCPDSACIVHSKYHYSSVTCDSLPYCSRVAHVPSLTQQERHTVAQWRSGAVGAVAKLAQWAQWAGTVGSVWHSGHSVAEWGTEGQSGHSGTVCPSGAVGHSVAQWHVPVAQWHVPVAQWGRVWRSGAVGQSVAQWGKV